MAGRAQRKLIRAIHDGLWAVRDPERAKGQQAYMKSAMPYMGIMTPVINKTVDPLVRGADFRSADDWQATVLAMWREAKHREMRYAAIKLVFARSCLDWLRLERLPMLDEMIVTGAWWDFIDSLAPQTFAVFLKREPEAAKRVLLEWSTDDDIWRRRSAILSQLKTRADTDTDLMFQILENNIGHDEFFVRKAMGWALRNHSYQDGAIVRRWIRQHEDALSPLTVREGLKALERRASQRKASRQAGR